MKIQITRALLAAFGWMLAFLTPLSAQEMEDGWDIKLQDFFRNRQGEGIPFTIYARSVDGEWKAGVGSSRGNFNEGRSPGRVYNTSWQHVDMSKVNIVDGHMKGELIIHMTPDLWVPVTGRSFPITFQVDAKLNEKGFLVGSYTSSKPDVKEPTIERMNFKGGRITSFTKPQKALKLPEAFTLRLNLQGVIQGGSPDYLQRCMVVYLGVKNGKVVKASHGVMTLKRDVISRTELDPSLMTLTRMEEDGFAGTLRIPTLSLDLEPSEYVIEVEGTLQGGLVTGMNQVRVTREGQEDVSFTTSFDGTWSPGISSRVYKSVLDETWFVEVEGHVPVKPGEHPRLLFRQSDVPALRERMQTPEGQAILKRLRYLLDGADGDGPPKVYSAHTKAYMGGGYVNHIDNDPGIYTFSHVAGYGLLYQLTGEQRYADLGKEAFQKAMDGQRDRDDRYSFRAPGGGLRAGPVLGWMAVGYDLCYNGWDEAFRTKATLALAEYNEGPKMNLESLARGTMPPGSNHFGMQVGGASLALLAIDGEKGVDQDKIDILKRIVKRNMIRNVAEGFGNGGMFQEGDGTGSMATYISYLSGLQAWRNAEGLDMVDNGRPHVPMTTLKWMYLSRMTPGIGISKKGSWDRGKLNYPIRGEYGHNVWAREGLSGAGYFAHGFAGIAPEQRPALLWFYNQFLKEADEAIGRPFDTVSAYPHLAVSAFVNWPVGVEPVNPAEIVPKITADTQLGLYMWRSRWQDPSDFRMSLLTNLTRGGYMKSKPDPTLKVDGNPWIELRKARGVKDWWVSDAGDRSILTFNRKDQALLVDFSGASGEEVLLATTFPASRGEKVKVGGKTVTLLFPRSSSSPAISVEGSTLRVGDQTLGLKGGRLAFL